MRGSISSSQWWLQGILLISLVVTSCTSGRPAATSLDSPPAVVPPEQARPLVLIAGNQPASFASRALQDAGISQRSTQRMLNALPALLDARAQPVPELLASLPILNSDSWQVAADGTMRTTYTLKPNLTWHDGQPLTADDFVFSWRVYATPDLGRASLPPLHAISEVTAPDPLHFAIRWKSPYADADTLSQYSRELPPLPQHVLGAAFEQMPTAGPDVMTNHPFWGQQYIGAGPFKISRWEAGAFIDLVRFDSYVLGAPKIPRIQLRFSVDQNVVVASMLAGEVQAAGEGSLPDYPETLVKEWGRPNAPGVVLQFPRSFRFAEFQLRPELVNPRAILDVRVRRAITHGVDKQAVSDAVYGGQALFADNPVWSGSAWGDANDESLPKYPLDVRAAADLMNQAGFAKGSDGLFAGPDGRLSIELATTQSAASATELAVIADSLRSAGFDVQQRVSPSAQSQNNEVRSSYSGIFTSTTNMGESAMANLVSSQIGTASNRWLGSNRGGWSNPEYDRLQNTFNTTLNRAERVAQMRQMLRLYAQELPLISLVYRGSAFAFLSAIKGPGPSAPESNPAWNVYEWEFN